MTTRPDVDVVTPVGRPDHALVVAVESVLSQQGDFSLGRIIIVNDGDKSPEGRAVLDSLSRRHPAIRVIDLPSNVGPAAARNIGTREASATWVAFLDADDTMLPGAIDVRLRAAREMPDIGMICGDFIWRDLTAGTERPGAIRGSAAGRALPPGDGSAVRLRRPFEAFVESPLAHMCSTLFSLDAFRAAKGFDERIWRQHDYNLFLRLTLRHDVLFVKADVGTYNNSVGSWSRRQDTNDWRALACLALLEQDLSDDQRRAVLRKVEWCYRARRYACLADRAYGAAALYRLKEARCAVARSLKPLAPVVPRPHVGRPAVS
ncbi:putative glycosyl transferase [Caenispirillum salinarum AK4]|uniref:Putative glycosyl transferase n=1 Tax=Caenispirillum salinarum AK4 TaxID=1238182 RepID=K9HX79_9PROT|nr:glycosyltransferase family A protein [Caenispirillum salinarum]EKV32771.1 putative glycosyl transferase [Caenispirillum salinarum AK4]